MKTPTKSNQIQTPRYMEPKSVAEASRCTEVEQAFVEINDKHENVEKLIHELRRRLEPVLRNDPPPTTTPANAPEPPAYATPMANRLHSVANDLHRDIRALEEILRLLEV